MPHLHDALSGINHIAIFVSVQGAGVSAAMLAQIFFTENTLMQA